MKKLISLTVIIPSLLVFSSCNITSVPANQGSVECDVIAHREEIVQLMMEMSRRYNFSFDDFNDENPSHGFLAASGNGSGDVVVSYLGTTRILIDKQQPPFVNASEEDVAELVSMTEELVSHIQRICGLRDYGDSALISSAPTVV